jgi:hypothetical protein
MLAQAVSNASTKRGTINWMRATALFCSFARQNIAVNDCKSRYYSNLADNEEEEVDAELIRKKSGL